MILQMAKTKKQDHKSPAEVKEELNEKAAKETDRECALEIEAVLKKHNRGLQAYMVRAENGSWPRVRLVRTETNVEKEGEE